MTIRCGKTKNWIKIHGAKVLDSNDEMNPVFVARTPTDSKAAPFSYKYEFCNWMLAYGKVQV